MEKRDRRRPRTECGYDRAEDASYAKILDHPTSQGPFNKVELRIGKPVD